MRIKLDCALGGSNSRQRRRCVPHRNTRHIRSPNPIPILMHTRRYTPSRSHKRLTLRARCLGAR